MKTHNIKFKTVFLPENQGHGNARRISLKESSNELVALMDADDICLESRFQKQLEMFLKNSETDIVGGQILEFKDSPENIKSRRQVPLTDKEIKEYMKIRCPMNQMTVMFKKAAYRKAGGYIDWYCNEDYYLWIRMAQCGCVFANVPEDVMLVRTGEEMSMRRGGIKYFKSEEKIQRLMLKNKMISPFRYIYNVALRFGGEVVATNSLRQFLFKFFRSQADSESIKLEEQTLTQDSADYPEFSVAMCVWEKDNPKHFDMALKSVINQTVKPSEIVLVVDGQIPNELNEVIEKYRAILCAV